MTVNMWKMLGGKSEWGCQMCFTMPEPVGEGVVVAIANASLIIETTNERDAQFFSRCRWYDVVYRCDIFQGGSLCAYILSIAGEAQSLAMLSAPLPSTTRSGNQITFPLPFEFCDASGTFHFVDNKVGELHFNVYLKEMAAEFLQPKFSLAVETVKKMPVKRVLQSPGPYHFNSGANCKVALDMELEKVARFVYCVVRVGEKTEIYQGPVNCRLSFRSEKGTTIAKMSKQVDFWKDALLNHRDDAAAMRLSLLPAYVVALTGDLQEINRSDASEVFLTVECPELTTCLTIEAIVAYDEVVSQ